MEAWEEIAAVDCCERTIKLTAVNLSWLADVSSGFLLEGREKRLR
jgi:hypothetical protein